LRATPHGERPLSVEAYERQGKVAKDRQVEIWKERGIEPFDLKGDAKGPQGYND
jgi:sulfonate dioxygenase